MDTGAESAPDTTEEKTETDRPAKKDHGDGSGGAEAPTGETGEQAPEGGSPEDQPGGAGDEIPARSQAQFTGRDGRVSPRLVRVPPFISVRVELRSADGAEYKLSGGGKTITRRRAHRVGERATSTACGPAAAGADGPRGPWSSRPRPSPGPSDAWAGQPASSWVASEPMDLITRPRRLPGHQRSRGDGGGGPRSVAAAQLRGALQRSGSASSGACRTSTSPRTGSTGTSASRPRSATSGCTGCRRSSSASSGWPRSSGR